MSSWTTHRARALALASVAAGALVLASSPALAQLTGACCRLRGNDFRCSDRVLRSTCAEGSGVPYINTVCASDPCGTRPEEVVACCAPNLQCAPATAIDCVQAIDGLVPLPEFGTCGPSTCTDSRLPALGGCCLEDGCSVLSETDCDAAGGDWNAGEVCFDGLCGLAETFPVEGGGVGGCAAGGGLPAGGWLALAGILAAAFVPRRR